MELLREVPDGSILFVVTEMQYKERYTRYVDRFKKKEHKQIYLILTENHGSVGRTRAQIMAFARLIFEYSLP